jgi:DNA-binding beta-propeller fold protein YncE
MRTSRRDVLKAGVTALSGTLLGRVVGAMQDPPQKRPVVGSGDHTYEVHHDWLTPPTGTSWGDTHGVVQDSQGRIYIAHTVHPSSTKVHGVVVFDAKGKFVDSWGAEFAGGAHGLDIRKEGSEEFLYHCDTRRRLVVKTDLKGRVIWERGVPMEPGVYADSSRWCPTNVAFAPNGDLFVGDGYGSSYVHRYTKDGAYVKVVCGPGSEAGKVNCPHGLWVDERGATPYLVVADRSNRRLQYFTLDGAHVKFVTEGMRAPCHLHFRNGKMLVPDLSSVVTILGENNQVLAHLGDGDPTNLRGAPREQFIPGKFVHPHGSCWVNGDDILVVEWVPIGRVTLLKKV